MDFDEYDFKEDSSDLPEEKRMGFFFEYEDSKPDFNSALLMAEKLFAEKKWFVDEDDYEWRIMAQTADEKNERLAWVEWRFKQGQGEREYHNYYLKARTTADDFWRWEIETYNPYFGCDVKFLDWLDDSVILIYEEKHDTYAARLDGVGVKRIKISSDWKISGGTLIDERNSQIFDLSSFEIES